MAKVGRPTKYQKKYCTMIIDFMAKGYSKEAFAGEIGVSKQRIYDWEKQFTEFRDAIRVAEAKSLLFWEEKGIKGVGQGKDFNDRAWKFNMQNRHKWTDKQEVDHTTKGERLNLQLVSYTDAAQNKENVDE